MSWREPKIKQGLPCLRQPTFLLAQLTLKGFEASWKQRPFNTWDQNIKATYERRIQVILYRTKILSSSIHIVVLTIHEETWNGIYVDQLFQQAKFYAPFLVYFYDGNFDDHIVAPQANTDPFEIWGIIRLLWHA